MQRIHRALICLCGLSCLLLLGGGCGQSEGGRCQIDSDCASGLVCPEGTTGNGRCSAQGAPSTIGKDAAADTTTDLASTLGPDMTPMGPEAGVEASTEAATPDANEPDTTESEAGSVDAGEQG